MADPTTVLIVDDHTVAREGLRAMLETDLQVLVVGEAADGQEALERVAELHPQVVLMDVRMPRLDGLEATWRIKAEYPTSAVIIMTSYDDDALVVDAVRAGAAGYLLKDASRTLLSHTLGAVANGGILIKASLLRKAINSLTHVPLAVMKGYAQALLRAREAMSSPRRTMLEAIDRGSSRIDAVVQDLLDISKLHAGRLELVR